MEVYSPDFGGRLPVAGARTRAVVFYDFAALGRNRPGLGEPHGSAVGSVGLGMRFSRGTNMSFRADYAIVVDGGGSQGRNDSRVHLSFSYVF
jgi:hemolysin activation/secretion protein